MNKEKIEKLFHNLGLSEKEAKVYLTALELGPATAQRIANAAGVKRPTTYNIIESLENRGLIRIQLEGFKKSYCAEDPTALRHLLETQQKELESMLPELKNLYGSGELNTAIKCYRGENAIRNAYEYVLQNLTPQDDYLVFGDLQSWYDSDPEYFKSWPTRRQKIISTGRSIYQNSLKAREYLSREKAYQTNVKIIPSKKQLSAIKLITSRFLLIHKTTRPYAVFIIENLSIVELYKEMFDTLWELLPKNS